MIRKATPTKRPTRSEPCRTFFFVFDRVESQTINVGILHTINRMSL